MHSVFACLLMSTATYSQDAAPSHPATDGSQSGTHQGATATASIEMLPVEVLSLILERTDPATQVAQTLVCRDWYALTRAHQLRRWWFEKLYVEIFPRQAAYSVPSLTQMQQKVLPFLDPTYAQLYLLPNDQTGLYYLFRMVEDEYQMPLSYDEEFVEENWPEDEDFDNNVYMVKINGHTVFNDENLEQKINFGSHSLPRSLVYKIRNENYAFCQNECETYLLDGDENELEVYSFNGVSDDGRTVYGQVAAPAPRGDMPATVFTRDEGIMQAPVFSHGSEWSQPAAANWNASIIVGRAGAGSGDLRDTNRAFVWFRSENVNQIYSLHIGDPQGREQSGAYGINASGTKVVGYVEISDQNFKEKACLWNLREGGNPQLLDLPDLARAAADQTLIRPIGSDFNLQRQPNLIDTPGQADNLSDDHMILEELTAGAIASTDAEAQLPQLVEDDGALGEQDAPVATVASVAAAQPDSSKLRELRLSAHAINSSGKVILGSLNIWPSPENECNRSVAHNIIWYNGRPHYVYGVLNQYGLIPQSGSYSLPFSYQLGLESIQWVSENGLEFTGMLSTQIGACFTPSNTGSEPFYKFYARVPRLDLVELRDKLLALENNPVIGSASMSQG